ncbi:MAG: Gfo/Idh/MocA family protein [Acidobacteriota bacterium]
MTMETATRKVKFGLIGAGWIGSHHGANVARNSGAELVAVADTRPEKAAAFVRECGLSARVSGDYQQLLQDPDIDAVIVASPNALHAEQAVAAAEAGKHIYLEKPMAINVGDCRRVAQAISRAGVKCAMGYHRRFNPLYQYAKQLQGEGKLGEIVFAESDYVHYIPGDWDIWEWLGKESVAGSLIHAGAGHSVDLLRYYCGEVAEVGCFKDVRMPRKIALETEDIAAIILRFESGALARLLMFLGPITPFTFTLRLFGTKGTLDNNRVWFDSIPRFCDPGHEGDCIQLPGSWIPDNVQGGIAEPWNLCIDSFIDDVRLDRRPANDHVSGYNTAAACFAAVRSAVKHRFVQPEKLETGN